MQRGLGGGIVPGTKSSLVTSDYLVSKNKHVLTAPRRNAEIVSTMLRAKHMDDHFRRTVKEDRGRMFDLIDSKYRTSYSKIQNTKSNRMRLLKDDELTHLKRATNKTTFGKGRKLTYAKSK
jgi:hypothetical protein